MESVVAGTEKTTLMGLHSTGGAAMTPRPKNSLTVPNRSLLRSKLLLKSSCCPVCSICALRIALIVSFEGLQTGHSVFLSVAPTVLVLFKHRWWKECLHMKCTVGKSRLPPQEEHRRPWNVVGLLLKSSSSAFLDAVSVRY